MKIKNAKLSQSHSKNKDFYSNKSRSVNKMLRPKSLNYLIWGKNAVEMAILNIDRKITNIYLTETSRDWIFDKLKKVSKPWPNLIKVEKNLLSKNSMSSSHQGVMAEVEPIEWPNIEDIIYNIKEKSRIILLDQVTNPQNIGAIIRLAKAFNADGIIVTKKHSPPENGLMARAAAGAIEKMPLIRVTNLVRAIEFLKKERFTVVGLENSGNKFLEDIIDFPRIALVFGSEGYGLRRLTKEKISLSIKIPIAVDTESLNVSTAAAIALYVTRGD